MGQQKIITNFWFDHVAEEAVTFYAGVFKDSSVGKISRYGEAGAEVSGMSKGEAMIIEFTLCGQKFVAINADSHFKFTPAVSMTVFCQTEEEIDAVYAKLAPGGKILMEYGKYPFSEKYAFLQDKFGVAWQLNLARKKQKLVPSLIFVGDKFGKAEAATKDYVAFFKDARVIQAERYPKGDPKMEGALLYGLFALHGQEFIAMDGAGQHDFTFSGAISFQIECEDQAEVDHFWNEFSRGGQEMPCGWVTDKYGISWQVIPKALGKLMSGTDPVKAERAMKAMFAMKKLDIAKLEQAYAGN